MISINSALIERHTALNDARCSYTVCVSLPRCVWSSGQSFVLKMMSLLCSLLAKQAAERKTAAEKDPLSCSLSCSLSKLVVSVCASDSDSTPGDTLDDTAVLTVATPRVLYVCVLCINIYGRAGPLCHFAHFAQKKDWLLSTFSFDLSL